MNPRRPSGLCKPGSFAAALLAALPLAASAATPTVPTLGPDQLQAGQKAEVRTVFRGDSIETFEAEIVGVVKGGRVDGDVILARATSPRLEHLGIAAGMSGSPVYVDGRLIGALSSGWSFSRDPIFGITPIGEMLEVLDQPEAPESAGSAGPTGVEAAPRSGEVRYGEFSWNAGLADAAPVETGAPASSERSLAPAPLPIPLACGGIRPEVGALLSRALGPLGFAVTPGGRSRTGGPTTESLRPGAAVAVDVLRGDLTFSAIGTVTYRDGDRVLIFGHPFFQAGPVRMPLSTATVTTVVASDLSSFKVATRGRSIGVVTQDRRAAVAGRLSGSARMLPLKISIRNAGSAPRVFRFESIEDRQLAPSLVSAAALNSLLESGGNGAGQTLRWTLTLYRRGAPPLVLRDQAAGDAPANDLAAGINAPLRFLMNNPFSPLRLDSVAAEIQVETGRAQWTLHGAALAEAAVRPGETVRVRCELERWRGERVTRELRLAMPEEVPEGRYILWVGGGAELARYEATRLPARYRPSSLDDAWRRLGAQRTEDRLYAALWARAPEITRDGVDYPELPISALAILASGQSAGDRGRPGDAALLGESDLPLEGPTRGELVLEVTVNVKAP